MSIQSEIMRLSQVRDNIAAAIFTDGAGPDLAECAAELEELQSALAYNLTRMGVPAAGGDPLSLLVPKVLRIPQGDTSVELFSGNVEKNFPVSLGYAQTGDPVPFRSMCQIALSCRVAELRLLVEAEENEAESGTVEVTVVGPGWTSAEIPSGVSASYSTGESITKFEAQDAFDNLVITVSGSGNGTLSVTPQGITESGQVISLNSAILIYSSSTTWAALEARELAMADLAAMTWAELEGLGKPDE